MEKEKYHGKKYLMKVSGIILICTASILIGCTTNSVLVNYKYEPVVAIKHPDQIPLLVPKSREIPKNDLERRISALVKALNIRFDPTKAKIKTAPDGETVVYSFGSQRFKVYPNSGMIKYSDSQLYNAIPKDFRKHRALHEDKAVKLAKEVVERLVAQEIIEKEEVLWDAYHVYYRKLQQGTGSPEKGGQAPKIEPPHNMDTRVFLSRIKEGLPVSGNGLRLVFTPEGKLASLNLMWRELKTGSKTYERIIDLARANKKLEKSLTVPKGARVEVLVNELVYFDPSPRDPVTFLEPGFLFVYVVKTPLKEKPGVFAISRKLHSVIPAIEHGLTQIPSIRKARLKRLKSKYGMEAHPEKPVPPTQKNEEETP